MDSRGDDGIFMAAGEGVGPGVRIAGYRVVDRVGRGGMAVVFRADDERLGRVVALKVLAPVLAEDEAFRQRFIRESRAAAAVDDPHIIPVFEAGEAGGVLFIAMRFVAGGDVRLLVRRTGPLTVSRAASIVSPVASALDAAHAVGLVHRDVKPANMLIDARRGRPDHVYLSDFGLSKGALSSVGLTGSGLFLGTPDYVAPEQIAGREVDGRADQYALACTAFEMLSGQPPFARDHGMAVIYAHASEPPPALTTRCPGLPAAVDMVLARALAKDPAERYGSCQDFGDALRGALGLGPYDVEAAGNTEERSATVVGHPVAGPAPDSRVDEWRDTVVSGAAAGTGSKPGGAPGGDRDERTLTAAPRNAGDLPLPEGASSPAALLADVPVPGESVRERRPPAQLPAATGEIPASGSKSVRKRRRNMLAAAAGLVLAAGVVGALSIPHRPPTSRSHENTASKSHENSSPGANPLVPMAPVAAGSLDAVIAEPGRSAWALGEVGRAGPGRLLIERWDGTAWSRVAGPDIKGGVNIFAGTAGPGGTAWAVGDSCSSQCALNSELGFKTLVLHWDGMAWSRIPSPSPAGGALLYSVSAQPDGTAWAVGCSPCVNTEKALILHWNGTAWSQVAYSGNVSPVAVAAGPGGTAWAVGPPILRWTGAAWTSVPAPQLGSASLNAVSAAPDGTAWAVGCTSCYAGNKQSAVILHWDGAKWSRVPSPSPGAVATLWSVSAGADGTAWAVGYYCASAGNCAADGFFGHTLILRWNGSAWSRVASPNPGQKDDLNAIAIGEDGIAWAVGQTCISQCSTSSAQYQTLTLRWNGTAWLPG